MARPKILNLEQEIWFISHYPDEFNDVLADQLSLMVNKENAKEAAKLSLSLCDFKDKERQKILNRIHLLQQPVVINCDTVSRLASRMGLRKSPSQYSKIKSNAVPRADFRKAMKKAESLISATKLLNSITPPLRKRYIILDSRDKMHSFNVTLTRWNKKHGIAKGFTVHAIYDYKHFIIQLTPSRL